MSAAAPQGRGSPAAEGAPLLRLEAITKRFPGVLALDRVDFDLRPGEVHVLFGENGAGKSTLISIAAGALRPDAGSIAFRGEPLQLHSVHHARSLGISAVFQEFSLVPQMTRRGEPVPRRRGDQRRPAQQARAAPARRGDPRPARLPAAPRPAGRVPVARRAADGRDRQGVPLRALGPDPGRADRLAHRARDRPAVPPDRAGQAGRRRRHLHHPSHQRDPPHRRSHHGAARRPLRRHGAGRHGRGGAGPADDRPGDRADLPADRLQSRAARCSRSSSFRPPTARSET